MIQWLVEAVQELVVLPQTQDPTPEVRRVWDNTSGQAVNAFDRYVQVAPLTSTPTSWDIGGETLHLRHEVVLLLTITGPDLETAEQERGPIVRDLLRRFLSADWANVLDPDGTQTVERWNASIDWGNLGLSETHANASLTLTFDTEEVL